MPKIIIHKMAELFCGPGGLALGAKLAHVRLKNTIYKIEPIWANDIDEDTCETYRHNIHPENTGEVLCCPIEQTDLKSIPHFDGLSFGFPCNDYSMVGEQKGINGRYGPLYNFGVKALNLHNPKWFLAENVSGLSSANDGLTFQRILNDLEKCGDCGYRLVVHKYKFEEYGVPQLRHRIIIVGIRSDLELDFRIPAPTMNGKKSFLTAQQAIENPPIEKTVPNNELTRQSRDVVERLKHIQPGENAWTAKLPKSLRLNVKGAKLSQIYRRLKHDQPAYTVTGSGGGGTHIYHWKENRSLTNRERARLQAFPDSFVFKGSKESVRRQIGMAVPPLAAKIIFEALLKTFARVSYDSVDPSYVLE